jgi:hypothetical protein
MPHRQPVDDTSESPELRLAAAEQPVRRESAQSQRMRMLRVALENLICAPNRALGLAWTAADCQSAQVDGYSVDTICPSVTEYRSHFQCACRCCQGQRSPMPQVHGEIDTEAAGLWRS